MKYLIIIILCSFSYGCSWIFNKEANNYGGSWTDCSFEYISPSNSFKTFESGNSNPIGFWVTILDSSNSVALPNTAIRYGKNPEIISGKTDSNGNFWIHSTKLDTVFLNYIGFDNQYYYRDKIEIDSVEIRLSPCTIHLQ